MSGDERKTPYIVCLCGSSRFIWFFAVMQWEIEKRGALALGLHLLPADFMPVSDHAAEHNGVAEAMDALHLQKIDMANEILVLTIAGYIGASTRREIEFATEAGKLIYYIQKPEEMPIYLQELEERLR